MTPKGTVRRFRSGLIALTGAIALAGGIAACSSDSSDSGDSGGSSSGSGEDIKIVANSWSASALDAEIAKQLIETNLKNKVEIVNVDENTMFAGLADGELDAVMEIWPSGVTAEEQAYLDDGTVTDIGDLGVTGRIGWFVPKYVIDENPDLATWEGYKDPAVAKEFATAETGDKGRFLATDPSYSQYDESIVAELGLPFEVKYSGSEAATVAELDSMVAEKKPVLMYWWTPTAAAGHYDLVKVELPPYTEECYKDPTKIACDYPEDTLFKAASTKLETKDPKVWAFLEKFQLSDEDQLEMLPKVEIDKQSPEDVAAEWIADNKDTWEAWFK
jgi:glycine betaine/proline transport system substrate-binding protein